MKRQFWLIGIVLLAALSACRSKSKDGPTDTYSSGVIAIAADESFEPIVQEEIDVFESLYPLAGIVPRYTTEVEAINLLLKDSVRLAIATRTLTEEEMNSFHSRKFYPREIKLATDGLALIVNRENPDSLLSCLLYTSKPATRLDFLGSSKTMTLIGCRCKGGNITAEHY